MRRAYLLVVALAVFAVGVPSAGALDVAAPTLTGPSSPRRGNDVRLTGTAPPAATVTVYPNATCAGTPVDSTVADAVTGEFQLRVSVPDNSVTTFAATATVGADTSPCSAPFTYTEDSTVPAPTIDEHPALLSNDTTPTFRFSDAESGVTFNCRLTSGPYPSCTSPRSYTVDEGQHTFFVKATDAVGNTAESSFTWTVDTTPPSPPTIVDGPTSPSASTHASFTFSGEAGASFLCQLDGGAFAACPNPAELTVADGAHALVVKAVDGAGNVSAASAPYSWVVDTVHPLVTITDRPLAVTNHTSADFSFSATPTPDRYECSLDGSPFAVCTSPQHYAALGDGAHAFAVRTVSAGGTSGPATRYAWRVDTAPPQTTIATAPPASSNSTSATFAFTSNEAGSTFVCSINSAGFTPCSSPHAYTGLGDGVYTFRVQAVDAAGNADASPATYTWRISGVGPPVADLQPPANVGEIRRNVGYGRLQLRWSKPADSDFDHVGVYVSTSRKTAPRKLVYSGSSQSYTDRRFRNGAYYRYLVVSYDHAKNASGGSSAVVPPSALLRSPRSGSVVRRTPTFRWAPVRGASFYNIQLYRRGAKVLSAWPNMARQRLTPRWTYRGHRFALRKGTYVWYVWPGFGPKAKSRYGQVLGEGSFRVR